jgi:hypothetical protein
VERRRVGASGLLDCRRGGRNGYGLHISDFGARRFGDRRSHFGVDHLAQPTLAGPGRSDRPRLARREDLIRDFIVAASKTYGDAIVNNEPKMPELIDLYALVSRMRVLAMPRAVACADVVMASILETYSAPNRTPADLRGLVTDGGRIDPVRDFAEAAREELRPFIAR